MLYFTNILAIQLLDITWRISEIICSHGEQDLRRLERAWHNRPRLTFIVFCLLGVHCGDWLPPLRSRVMEVMYSSRGAEGRGLDGWWWRSGLRDDWGTLLRRQRGSRGWRPPAEVHVCRSHRGRRGHWSSLFWLELLDGVNSVPLVPFKLVLQKGATVSLQFLDASLLFLLLLCCCCHWSLLSSAEQNSNDMTHAHWKMFCKN